MNNNDLNKFKEMIMVISETYGIAFSEAKLRIWWKVLEPYTIEQFVGGIESHISCIRNGKYPPTPSHIIEKIKVCRKPVSDQELALQLPNKKPELPTEKELLSWLK
ncbi:hypothetical protein [Vibrio casei]|uniref:hypothetical protein n=1 Tax=Vibrio casei TaxID=673372 RepID=UPI003F957CD5